VVARQTAVSGSHVNDHRRDIGICELVENHQLRSKSTTPKWAEESSPGDRGKYAHGNSRLIDAMTEEGGLAMVMH